MAEVRIPASGKLTAEPGTAAPKRGRPRSEQADRAILQAASELLAERGLAGMSIEEVASRAGVGKTTVYRRWNSRGTLALDAFLAEFQAQQPLPDTGTLHDDLLFALRAWMRSVTGTSAGPILAALIAEAQRDPALAASWRERVVERLRDQHKIMLGRAVERGEIPAETKTWLCNLPLFHRDGDWFFVHAGIDPYRPLGQQRSETMLWSRLGYEGAYPEGVTVVHGHTPHDEPEIRQHRINLDTGACYGGNLTCAVLTDRLEKLIYAGGPQRYRLQSEGRRRR